MRKSKLVKRSLVMALSAAMVFGMASVREVKMAFAAQSGEEQSDENWIQAGDFSILTEGVSGTDYEYDANMRCLNILSETPITIKNTDFSTSTIDHIAVKADVSADITLSGVNIDVYEFRFAAFKIEDDSTGDVTVNLVGKNYLSSGGGCAGLQKNGSGVNVGTLVIKGTGELTALGGILAAGIGGASMNSACNIEISGGTVTATGGGYGAGIGGGDQGAGADIRIKGGSVKAALASWGEANAIGGGVGQPAVTPTNGSEPVYLLEIDNPDASAIQVNGSNYTPVCHGDEKKVYAYLPAGTKASPAIVKVKEAVNAYWYDTDNSQWSALNVVDIPQADMTAYTYNGAEQTYAIAESDYYIVSGNVQKEAGRYTVKVSLSDKENNIWSDGTREDKTYTFMIGQGILDTAVIEKNIELSCDKTVSKVGDVTLPKNWSFDNADENTPLTAGSKVDVTAVYQGTDKENFTEDSRKVKIHITKKAHTDADGDGICDIEGCGQYIDGLGAKLAGYSLSLAGNIGVNFYMELSDEVAAGENAYMNFTLPDGTQTQVKVKSAKTAAVNGKNYYVFTCEVAAKEMTDTIKAQIVAGDKKGTEYTYTVKEYADYIIEHAAGVDNPDGFDESTVSLAKSMLNYGGKAQKYFEYNLDNPADKVVSNDAYIADSMKDIDAGQFENYGAGVTGDTDICSFVSAYLSLKSQTDICVYVKLSEGVNPEAVTFVISDEQGNISDSIKASALKTEKLNGNDCYKLTVKDIPAHKLDGWYNFKVSAGSGNDVKTATLRYSAYSYAKTIMSAGCDGMEKIEILRDTLKAMQLYQSDAKLYSEQFNN